MEHLGKPDYRRIEEFKPMARMLMRKSGMPMDLDDGLDDEISGLIATQLVHVKELQDEVAHLKTELAVRNVQIARIKRTCEKEAGEDE